ncbi:MAG: DUF2182 domain-containing protein [Nevskia sp.]|nr:DUF2182 domain-containing protein [Nevskia sp.]
MSGDALTPLESQLQRVLMRDRLWIGAGLALVLLLSWGWVVPAALDMRGDMRGLAAWMMAPAHDARYAALLLAMWFVMMTAMMVPSAAPTLLLYGRVVRSQPGSGTSVRQVYAFGIGYLLAWLGFSVAATALQLLLGRASMLTPMMHIGERTAAASLLVLAGAYQWMPLKRGCLAHCRSPAGYIARHWLPGVSGAVRMGIRHGIHCLGCCWALMLLLFVGGVMSLGWIAALTLLVLVEKLAPSGDRFGRILGLLLAGSGAVLLWGG